MSAPVDGAFEAFAPGSARPGPWRGAAFEAWRLVCGAYLKLAGWRIEGDWPRHLPRVVLLAAPHTSNWDGVNMLAAAGHYRVPLKWMGKKELVGGPFGGLIRALGCVPVDREAGKAGGGDLVRQMAEAFRAAAEMTLAVAPEGTRAATRDWKSGFYRIAAAANVPIVLSVLDYGTRTITLKGAFTPSGDYDRDLVFIKAAYADAKGLREESFRL